MESRVVLELAAGNGIARYSEGSFVTLNDKSILFAYSKFLGDDCDDQMPSLIVCRTSTDSGVTWGPERILAEPENGSHNIMSVSLLRLQDQRILLLYAQKTEIGNHIFQCTPIVRFSDDEMETLSAAVPLTLSTDYHVVNNDRVIQLQSGRLVVPVAHHRFGLPSLVTPQCKTPHPSISMAGLVFYFLSDDGGISWEESAISLYHCFPDGTGLQEPGVIELNDGRLWSWARTGWHGDEKAPRQWQSFSEDHGSSWSTLEPSVFISPCSPLSMKRIPVTGDLLAIWNDHSGRFPVVPLPGSCDRTPLACAISKDEGITWQHHNLLESIADHGFCYTAIHFVDDAVLLAYCAGGASSTSPLDRTRVRRIPLAEFYA